MVAMHQDQVLCAGLQAILYLYIKECLCEEITKQDDWWEISYIDFSDKAYTIVCVLCHNSFTLFISNLLLPVLV